MLAAVAFDCAPPAPKLAPGMAADTQVAALRRQLGGLSYDASGLSAAAAPLVAALLDDLVKATDSYRALKAQTASDGQAFQSLQYKVG